jgi:protein involved in polysaccharide export with SLBB domain
VALMVGPALLTIAAAGQSLLQAGPASPGSPVTIEGSNLPFQPIGASDLVRLGVSASPGLSQVFRVDLQGNLNLPLLRAPISARGLMPNVLGDEIAAALRAQHLLVNPIVVVSVVEYAGRGVTVAGAVRTPTTIQDLGNLRVLGALVEAGGLLPGAGPEISHNRVRCRISGGYGIDPYNRVATCKNPQFLQNKPVIGKPNQEAHPTPDGARNPVCPSSNRVNWP